MEALHRDADSESLMSFTALVHEDEDGGYWAQVAELPGAITQGDTEEELEANLQEVIALMLETTVEDYVNSLKSRIHPEESDTIWRFDLSLTRVKK